MKTGLIVEGGGLKCVYSTAILDKLLKENINFDYGIGVSAGATNLLNFAAKQYQRAKSFFTIYSQRPEYMGLRNIFKAGEYINQEYIYDVLSASEGEYPIDIDEILKNPMEIEFVATEEKTGGVKYFNKSDLAKDDFEAVKATTAVPIASKGIEIDGKVYYDGGIIDPLPVQRALDMGCDKLLILLAQTRDFVKPPQSGRFIYTNYFKDHPKFVKAIDNRHIVHKKAKELAFKLEKENKAMIIAPQSSPDFDTLDKEGKKATEFYNKALEENPDIREKWLEFINE